MQMQSDLKFSSCSFGRHPEEADTPECSQTRRYQG
jgi:hypothetical protein